jgi:hypothetical protein
MMIEMFELGRATMKMRNRPHTAIGGQLGYTSKTGLVESDL